MADDSTVQQDALEAVDGVAVFPSRRPFWQVKDAAPAIVPGFSLSLTAQLEGRWCV